LKSPNHSKDIFFQILSERAQGRQTLAVFDLDSTIFNVSPRTQRIFNEFLAQEDIRTKYPKEVEFLHGLVILPQDWGIKQAIVRSGLKSTDDFYMKIRDFWRKNFFSSSYLQHDRPYAGAIEYVQALASKGIEIYYLTGRDEQNMRLGTVASLAQWGLPVLNEHTHLIMKPVKGSAEDEDFKEMKLRQLMQKYERPSIWFFENEPLIIEKVVQSNLPVKVIWVDTTHSGRAAAPENLPVIQMDGWEF
jgi:hypothetical protein